MTRPTRSRPTADVAGALALPLFVLLLGTGPAAAQDEGEGS
jgi:hypothetical protein